MVALEVRVELLMRPSKSEKKYRQDYVNFILNRTYHQVLYSREDIHELLKLVGSDHD